MDQISLDRSDFGQRTPADQSSELYREGLYRLVRFHPDGLSSLRDAVVAEPSNIRAVLALGQLTPSPREQAAMATKLKASLGRATRSDRLLLHAFAAFKRSEFELCLSRVAACLAEDPSETLAWLLAARACGEGWVRGGWHRYVDLCRQHDSSSEPTDIRAARLAFALHETRYFAESEQHARVALETCPDNGAAMHSMLHILYETSRHREGLDLGSEWLGGVAARGRLRAHLAWHVGIHANALGSVNLASQVLRAAVMTPATPLGHTVDAASLMWRLYLRGELDPADLLTLRLPPPGFPYPTLQPLAALGTAFGLALLKNQAQLTELEISCLHATDARYRTVAHAARGLSHWCEQDWQLAAVSLKRASDERWRLGGSRIQQEIILWTWRAAVAHSRDADSALRRSDAAPASYRAGPVAA